MAADWARSIADVHGLGTPTGDPVPAARGELGRIWRLDTSRGAFAVKELLDPMTEAEAQADVAFQLVVLEAGLPIPRPIPRRDGAILTTVAATTWRVYMWVDLAKPDRPPPPEDAAALLARIHVLDVSADGPMDPWFASPLGPPGWGSLVADVRAVGPPWLDQFERLAPGAQAAEAIIPAAGLDAIPVADMRRCHLDYNFENVLLDVDANPVIVDWENSGPGVYEQELGSAILDFAAKPAAAAAFLRAYRDAGGPAHVSGRSSFAMAIAVQSHLTDAYARRGISATTDEDRARAAYRIDELDRTLFTIDVVDRILEVLGRR